jgi:acylphosphatase
LSFIGAKVIIRGMVQGVGFRYWTRARARGYDLKGEVGNLRDGSVRVITEGDRGMIEEFIRDLKTGPSGAYVTDLKIEWYNEPKGYDEFNIVMMDIYE